MTCGAATAFPEAAAKGAAVIDDALPASQSIACETHLASFDQHGFPILASNRHRYTPM
jgi:hypothetical protein